MHLHQSTPNRRFLVLPISPQVTGTERRGTRCGGWRYGGNGGAGLGGTGGNVGNAGTWGLGSISWVAAAAMVVTAASSNAASNAIWGDMTPADPSTTGMAATYAANSDFQKDSAAAAVPRYPRRLRQFCCETGMRPSLWSTTAPGPASGLALFRTIIDEVRARDSTREVTVVHQDLVGNAWGDLLTRLRQDPIHIFGRTTRHQCWPRWVRSIAGAFPRLGALRNEFHGRSLDVRAGASFGAGECGSGRCRSDQRRRIASDAAADWRAFWRCREHELAPWWGNHRQVHRVVGGSVQVDVSGLLEMLGEAFQSAADAGLVSQQAADGYVLSEYPRTVREARAPFEAGRCLRWYWRAPRFVPNRIPTAHSTRRMVTRRPYASRMTGFVRAFTESSVRQYLSQQGVLTNHTVDEVTDWIYQCCQDRWRDRPDVHPFEAWTLTVIACKIWEIPVGRNAWWVPQ